MRISSVSSNEAVARELCSGLVERASRSRQRRIPTNESMHGNILTPSWRHPLLLEGRQCGLTLFSLLELPPLLFLFCLSAYENKRNPFYISLLCQQINLRWCKAKQRCRMDYHENFIPRPVGAEFLLFFSLLVLSTLSP